MKKTFTFTLVILVSASLFAQKVQKKVDKMIKKGQLSELVEAHYLAHYSERDIYAKGVASFGNEANNLLIQKLENIDYLNNKKDDEYVRSAMQILVDNKAQEIDDMLEKMLDSKVNNNQSFAIVSIGKLKSEKGFHSLINILYNTKIEHSSRYWTIYNSLLEFEDKFNESIIPIYIYIFWSGDSYTIKTESKINASKPKLSAENLDVMGFIDAYSFCYSKMRLSKIGKESVKTSQDSALHYAARYYLGINSESEMSSILNSEKYKGVVALLLRWGGSTEDIFIVNTMDRMSHFNSENEKMRKFVASIKNDPDFIEILHDPKRAYMMNNWLKSFE